MWGLVMSACGHVGIDLGDGASGARDGAGAPGKDAPSGGALAISGGSAGASQGGSTTGGSGDSGGSDAAGGQGGALGGSGGAASGGAGSGAAGFGGGGSGGADDTGGASAGGRGGTAAEDCDQKRMQCDQLAMALVHRYSFSGTGSAIVDVVAGANGMASGAVLDGSGVLGFDGDDDFVDLPAGLISSLPNATFEVWFVWQGGASWQRLFEFGDTDFLNDPVSYLYVTPQAGGTIPSEISLGAGLRHLTGGDRQLRTTEVTALGVLNHVVLTADDVGNRLTLYKNGQWVAQRDTEVRLSGIRDDTNRLGRSLFPDDPYFAGEITEFRIYAEVLTPTLIEASYTLGPDVVF